jgi:hypothetical protein
MTTKLTIGRVGESERGRLLFVLIGFSFFVATLAVAVSSSSAGLSVEPGTFPISQLPALAQQYAPGAAVPTKFPPGVGQFRPGPGRLNGYSTRAAAELFFEKNGSSLLGFKLDVFHGSVAATIDSSVKRYLSRGGWTVTTAPFAAGTYHGLLQRQSNGGTRFEMYTWATHGLTYVLTAYVLYVGKAQNTWSKTGVIASFKNT